MTLEDTRRLGIEFERRIQTMIPDTEFLEKLDTETIYSYLNQYQDKYVHEIYRNLDQIQSGSHLSAHVESVLQSLMDKTDMSIRIKAKYSVDKIHVTIGSGQPPTEDLVEIQVESRPEFEGDGDYSIDEVLRQLQLDKKQFKKLFGKSIYDMDEFSVAIPAYAVWFTFTPITPEEAQYYINDDIVEDGKFDFKPEYGFEIIDTGRCITYTLPNNFYMYIRSASQVSKSFSFKADTSDTENRDAQLPIRVIPNKLVSQSDVWRLIETPHDSLRILRYPAAVLNKYADGNPTMTVIYDQYTDPTGVSITYYKQPARFSLMTSTPCQLPLDAFEELVSGAVDLYVQYVAGAVANKERIQRARAEAAKEAERNNARRGRNSE